MKLLFTLAASALAFPGPQFPSEIIQNQRGYSGNDAFWWQAASGAITEEKLTERNGKLS